MLNFHNDDNIKILYDRKVVADYQELEAIGATDSLTLRELGFTPDNTNSIFVSKDGNNSNDGTEADPVLTIERANELVTAGKSNIVIMDSEEYEENYINVSSNCRGIYSSIGETPIIRPTKGENLDVKAEGAVFQSYHGGAGEISPKAMGAIILADGRTLLYEYYGINTSRILRMKHINPDGTIGALKTHPVGMFDYQMTGRASTKNFWCLVGRQPSINKLQIRFFNPNGDLIYSDNSLSCVQGDSNVAKFDENTVAIGYHHSSSQVAIVIKNISGTNIYEPKSIGNVWLRQMVYDHKDQGVFITYALGSTDTTEYVKKLSVDGNLSGVLATITTVKDDKMYIDELDHYIYFIRTISDTTVQIKKCNYDFTTVQDWTTITTFASSTFGYGTSVVRTVGGAWAVNRTYNTANSSGWSHFKIISSDLIIELYNKYYSGSLSYEIIALQYNIYSGMLVAYGSRRLGTTNDRDWRYSLIFGFTKELIKVENNTGFELNGITFKSRNYLGFLCNCVNILDTVDSLKVKWCNFENLNENALVEPNNSFNLFSDLVITRTVPILSKAADNEIKNSKFINNFRGVEIISNSVLAERNIFHFNGRSNSISVRGSGTNLSFNHNDFLYNKIGIYLEDNSGDEIIKNSIFFKNINADIEAETPVELNHSLFTGILTNCTLGTKVLQVNPLYINDGFNDITKINLNLKRKLLGFLIDSAGLGLADDGGDAGGHKTVILGVEETWKEIKVPKGEMKRKFGPAWAVSNIFDSGRMKSQKKGMVETIEIDWSKGLRSEFVDKIIQLNTCDSSEVRLYPDPATHPLDYGTFTFEYQEIDLDPGTNRLSNRGYKGVKMIFKRSVEDMVL